MEKTFWLTSKKKNPKLGENKKIEKIEKSNFGVERNGVELHDCGNLLPAIKIKSKIK